MLEILVHAQSIDEHQQRVQCGRTGQHQTARFQFPPQKFMQHFDVCVCVCVGVTVCTDLGCVSIERFLRIVFGCCSLKRSLLISNANCFLLMVACTRNRPRTISLNKAAAKTPTVYFFFCALQSRLFSFALYSSSKQSIDSFLAIGFVTKTLTNSVVSFVTTTADTCTRARALTLTRSLLMLSNDFHSTTHCLNALEISENSAKTRQIAREKKKTAISTCNKLQWTAKRRKQYLTLTSATEKNAKYNVRTASLN